MAVQPQPVVGPEGCLALARGLAELGVVDVTELDVADWRGLAAWTSVRPFEQRRLLNLLPPAVEA